MRKNPRRPIGLAVAALLLALAAAPPVRAESTSDDLELLRQELEALRHRDQDNRREIEKLRRRDEQQQLRLEKLSKQIEVLLTGSAADTTSEARQDPADALERALQESQTSGSGVVER